MKPDHEAVLSMQSDIFGAMGHPIRLAIVGYLGDGERAVTDIVKAVGAEQSNVSRHLAVLRGAGVLTCRKSGLKVYYRLSSPELKGCIAGLCACINEMVRARAKAAPAAPRPADVEPRAATEADGK